MTVLIMTMTMIIEIIMRMIMLMKMIMINHDFSNKVLRQPTCRQDS